MRTLILSTACIFTLNVLVAQQSDLALLDSNFIGTESMTAHHFEPSLVEANSIYLKENESASFSTIVKQWRKKLANYNLKNTAIFDDSEKAIYNIVFKNKQINIIANYDSNGKILATKEIYKNIKIPFELRMKISKTHPEYSFLKNSYHLTYHSKNGIESQYYQIRMGKGNKKITLKYNENFKLL